MRTFSTCDELFSQGQAVFLPRNAPDTDRNGRPEGTTVLHVQLRHPTHQTCRNTRPDKRPHCPRPLRTHTRGPKAHKTQTDQPPSQPAARGRLRHYAVRGLAPDLLQQPLRRRKNAIMYCLVQIIRS